MNFLFVILLTNIVSHMASAGSSVLSDEQLNLSSAHYKEARQFYSTKLLALKTPVSILPTLQTGERTTFQVGDTVNLGISALYRDFSGSIYPAYLEGRIVALVYEGEVLVGLKVQRPDEDQDGHIETFPILLVWLNDLDPDAATILHRPNIRPLDVRIQSSDIQDPENSFPILFPYGQHFLVPLSVGDSVSFYFREANGEQIRVSARGMHRLGRIVEAFVRDSDGNPVGFKYRYDSSSEGDKNYKYERSRISTDGLVTVYFREIFRMNREPRIDVGYVQNEIAFPKSRQRLRGRINSREWLPNLSNQVAYIDDSGSFMLRVRLSHVLSSFISLLKLCRSLWPLVIGSILALKSLVLFWGLRMKVTWYLKF